ncbi:LysE family transporter [Roseibacterium sp. SDUM158017]|uniref:LysE family translocator n=1 Tax=Roseicyclus salinarum TaxID=3036773 RepID=UPI0024154261|nr:LysE family transporter [Roseibacterium sp. SDUM158017]MDG4647884.1 LysE family transporter [Roseibacterium sp. SDUM158017]
MGSFLAAVVLLTATPGPGVLSVAGVGAAYGRRAGLRFVLGVFIGTNAVAILAASGLAAVVMAEPRLRLALTVVSVGYLGWLALRIAMQGDRIALATHARPPGVAGGIVLQLANPKCHAVNLSLFSGFPISGFGVGAEIAVKFAVINAVWVPVHFAWLAGGNALSRVDMTPGSRRALNLAMAMAMLAAVALALAAG